MNERDLEEELLLEELRDRQSRRKAREQKDAFGLVARAVFLLMTVVGFVHALVYCPQALPFSAIWSTIGGSIELIYRQRR